MIHNKRNRAAGGLGQIQRRLADELKARGSELADGNSTAHMLSLESLDEASYGNFEQTFVSLESEIENLYADVYSGESIELTPAQKTAGAVAMMAGGDLNRYSKAMVAGLEQHGGENVRVVDATLAGAGGQLDYRDQPSMEAFDEQELRNHLPFSVAFNVQAARQDEFSEAFYPTVVLTPDQAGLDIIIRRTTVFNEVRHKLEGTAADFNRRNLIDAVIEADILANNSIKAIPVYSDGVGGSPDNTAQFMDDAPAVSVTVDNTTFDTKPLATGVKHDILGLSSHPGLLAAGVLDSSDALDARVALENIYLRLSTGAGDGAAGANPDTVHYYKLSVDRLPFSAFIRPAEGNYRRMTLNFHTDVLAVENGMLDVNGAAGALGQLTADKILRLAVELSGYVNVETGELQISQTHLAIDSVWTRAGGVITKDADQAGSIAAAEAELDLIEDMTIAGFDLYATRSNANRRSRGLLVNVTEEVERHTVMMGSPITILSPVAAERDGSDLTAAVTAARIRNSNQAVTTLINYAEMLKGLKLGDTSDRTTDIPQIEGAGRWLVRPWFEELTLNLTDVINSIKSHERAEDVAGALINAIRDMAYRMYRDSGYQAALDALTGGTGEKPVLVIGTDPVLARHLQLIGDTRLAGIQLEHKVVVSMDKRVYNNIFLSFVRPNQQGADPLSLGTHAWIPELATTVQVSRNGATTKEAQVQPRNRHVNNLPVMGRIIVQNLEEVLTTRIDQVVVNP